ncbi:MULTISPECIES: DUF3237 domain-containing protein [Aquirufa]|jgi:hypothetical protein|uniref:DUF3237 domain-containing protein n=1 Tax=Aquirufa TaxID=2676247 RepID=UPI001CAA6850|nr:MULTISPECIES: DUF3237 domain-containing protein [Aquirufa]UAJ14154.1 DUF3237 domain-containing protein [Aquirufa lenticrescens]USQ03407.1 DUF3237 domain-containing protein [Aquirufa antheringensis]
MKKILFLFFMSITMSQAQKAPALDFFCELKVKLDPALIVGETPHGTRRIIPIIGGTVEGPKIKGEILNGGADWQILRADGVTELEAHYQFRTDDGTLIYVKNTGIRAATPEIAARLAKGEKVDANEYYFRAMPKFDAPKGKYDWVNNSLFVCTGERLPDYVLIRVWKVM